MSRRPRTAIMGIAKIMLKKLGMMALYGCNPNNLKERALLTLKKMGAELQRLELRNDIQSKTRTDMDQQQREYYLHQQLKTIQEELGGVSFDEELEEMKVTTYHFLIL